MKSINTFINEARTQSETTLYFPNLASWFIFTAELSGQISDGYWENARPATHWKWIMNTTSKIDDNKVGYEGPRHQKYYDTSWLRKYVKKALKGIAGDYDWTIRVFKYAKFAALFNKSDFNKLDDLGYSLRAIVENLPEEPVTVEEFEAQLSKKDWMKKYWDKVKSVIDDKILKKYYKSKYGWSEFEDDLEMADETINTQLTGA